jgi:hypothetical protein
MFDGPVQPKEVVKVFDPGATVSTLELWSVQGAHACEVV